MINIIRSELKRLAGSKAFYITLAVSLLLAFNMADLKNGHILDFDLSGTFGMFAGYYGLIAAPMTALFAGREFSDGTVRNKLICGRSRAEVYIAETVVCSLAAIVIQTSVFAMSLIYCKFNGIVLIVSVWEMIKIAAVGYIAVITYTVIFVMAVMLICDKTSSVVWSEVMAVLLMLAGGFAIDKKYSDKWRNNKAILLMNDIIPFSQTAEVAVEHEMTGSEECIEITFDASDNAVRCMVYGSLTIFLTTAAGIYFFRKKTLK
ncbi:MAG: ABC transporter permease [Ruminococcus sp.]|uniref:hypothetical protein n=1 Tax=Ruminococcus sp. TaxID=41978 RepID=UPI0025F91ED4|nr:hypothetical protein [Ruminococcus sp.]MCR5601108.1 ABC transporter permease [Ruminococcus sp.]